MARELLRLAGVLAEVPGGLRGFTHVGRSRATSTAYQAVFHGLATLCATELAGLQPSRDAYEHVYRSIEHSVAATAFKRFVGDANTTDVIRTVGRIFLDLQGRRQQADYDPFYYVKTRREMAIVIADAGRALDGIDDLPPSDRKLLAARLIGRPRR